MGQRGAEPASKTASWSTKPKQVRQSAVAKQRAKDQAATALRNRDAWAKRHPEKAAAERLLRIERVKAMRQWGHKNNGTPATHAHATRVGALARLHQSGAIDDDQLASSAEIAIVAVRIGADVAVRTARLEAGVDMSRHGDAFWEALGAVRAEVAYTRWRAQLRGCAAPVLDMIVGDSGVTVVAKQYRMHVRKAKAMLVEALDMWPRYHAEARKEIDPATLLAAQAGIL
ncbi:MAG: hypothetical protein QHC67_03595 [Sphingobium sp.]|uniref:hypothetical protein n=1 Tax=Sphingobium sp. TaxID=1912891 RepID=UPI0029B9C13F|nr:hypothetical protein [Sphingobium sp.]MDX3908883.1 hypothetical protein [Sphingobium sp.]